MLYRGGSDYCIDIVARGEKGGLYSRSSAGITSIFSSVFASGDRHESDQAKDMFKGLVFLYHPKCCIESSLSSEGGFTIPALAMDAAPEPRDKGVIPMHAV